jgi:branched-chain amino acid transport system substrate-binding protein
VWWTPTHPFSSSLTGASAQALSDEYTEATGKQWTQFVGFVHAVLEVCLDSVARAGSTDKQALVDAIAATNLDTIVGPVTFGREGLPKNVSPTPLVGGQWQQQEAGAPFPFELLVVDNTQAPEIPTGGTMVPLGG